MAADPSEGASKPKPTWLVPARPKGMTHEEWRTIPVQARSPIQAVAILNRAGYEADPILARLGAGAAPPVPPALPNPIRCSRCDYELDGIRIGNATLVCPECGYGQVVMAWSPLSDSRPLTVSRAIINILAVIGFLAMLLIGVFGVFATPIP